MSIDYGDDFNEEPRAGDLENLTNLAHRQRDLEQEIEQAQEHTKKLQEQHRDLAWSQIPTLMDQLRIKKFTLSGGFEIDISEQLRVSVPKKNQTEAYAWVDEHGGSHVVKRGFVIAFTKEQEAFARKFKRDCDQRKHTLPMEETKTVAPATLKKFLNDKLESGENVPLKMFGAYRQRIAKINVK